MGIDRYGLHASLVPGAGGSEHFENQIASTVQGALVSYGCLVEPTSARR